MHMNSGRDAQQSWLAVRWDKKGLFAGFFAAYLSRSTPKNITPVYAILLYTKAPACRVTVHQAFILSPL